jgi:hypothetical protein
MRHPFEQLTPTSFRRLYAAAWLGTLAVAAVLQIYGNTYAAIPGPNGERYDVMALEFAGTPERLQAIFAVWGEEGMRAARIQTWVDCLFPFCYAALVSATIVALLRAGLPGRWQGAARLAAWAQWKAGALDLIENTALLAALYGGPVSPFPQVAAGAAAVKFALLAAGLLFFFAALPMLRGMDGRPGDA